EVGLTGGDDPDCRRCMVWEDEKIDIDLLNHYKKLTKIRKENKELIDGTTEILVSEDKVLVYKRVLGNDSIMVIINNSKESLELDLGLRGNYKDIYNEKDIFIDEKLRINEFNFNILKL
ncbi:MAG: alpha-glucosidase C-terminal domain-containing protein, partial [Clostridium sp.]